MIDPRAGPILVEQADSVAAAGSPFTAALVRLMAGDLTAGGPVSKLLDGWQARTGDAMVARMAAAVRYAALSGRAAGLAAAYPDGAEPQTPEALWPRIREYLQADHDFVEDFIRRVPQTNEVGRTLGLLLGFTSLADQYGLPLRTLEIGASAGLNLHWDRFAYQTSTWALGHGPVTVSGDWIGPPPPATRIPQVVAREGCDLAPIDLNDPDALLRLRSYIWADQAERLRRFDQAVALAKEAHVRVDREGADTWLPRKLAEPALGVCTVVYHSIFLMYPPPQIRDAIRGAIEAAGRLATARAPLAWLRYEPEGLLEDGAGSPRQIVDLITWPGGVRQVLAEVDSPGLRVVHLDQSDDA